MLERSCCGKSPRAQELLKTTLKHQATCNKSLHIISNKKLMSIFPLQVTSNVQASMNIFLQTQELPESDSFFGNLFESYRPASLDHEISKVGSYLVSQLKKFVSHRGSFTKDIKKIQCTETLSVPVVVDDAPFHKKINLLATVNHTGTPDNGHYTAHVKLFNSSSCQFCNEAAVLRSSVVKVNNTSSCMYIYKAF